MNKKSFAGVITLIVVGLISVAFFVSKPKTLKQQLNSQDNKGLKDHYQEYFPIGVAVTPGSVEGAEAEFIRKHFNSLTAENVMKMGPIHPGEDRYNWGPADKILKFARENNMKARGHALCWHNQVPEWIFEDSRGGPVAKEILLQRLKKHINEVVTRYKRDVYAWDVVNEAVSDNEGEFLRRSKWLEIGGEEYIAKAFQFAHEADPEALLFYNDYNTTHAQKRDKIYRLVKSLLDTGVPIHGIGMQAHWSIYGPGEREIRDAIDKFASLGLQVQITELDVSVYPPENGRREKRPDESDQFTQEMQEKQARQYRMFFNVFRDYKDVLTGVTFWNVSDRYSWLDYYPVSGRKNYPLLFDQDLEPKEAYWEVINF